MFLWYLDPYGVQWYGIVNFLSLDILKYANACMWYIERFKGIWGMAPSNLSIIRKFELQKLIPALNLKLLHIKLGSPCENQDLIAPLQPNYLCYWSYISRHQ